MKVSKEDIDKIYNTIKTWEDKYQVRDFLYETNYTDILDKKVYKYFLHKFDKYLKYINPEDLYHIASNINLKTILKLCYRIDTVNEYVYNCFYDGQPFNYYPIDELNQEHIEYLMKNNLIKSKKVIIKRFKEYLRLLIFGDKDEFKFLIKMLKYKLFKQYIGYILVYTTETTVDNLIQILDSIDTNKTNYKSLLNHAYKHDADEEIIGFIQSHIE